MTSKPSAERVEALDFLRAVAVLLVLETHMARNPAESASAWFRGGWIGVDLFFVLSGFLVSGLLFREYQRHGQISAKQFLVRRGFKIYPGFWLLLLAGVMLQLVKGTGPRPHAVIANLLFIQNYGPTIWGHEWTLAVEEHFYLILLLLIVWLLRLGDKESLNPFEAIPKLFLLCALSCLTFRLVTAFEVPYQNVDWKTLRKHFFPTHLRLDSLFFGVLISYFYHYHSQEFLGLVRRKRPLLLAVALIALTPAFLLDTAQSPFMFTYGYSLVYLGCGLLLASFLTIKIPDLRIFRALACVGFYSYSIYLWHVPVIRVVTWSQTFWPATLPTPVNWLWYVVACFTGAIGFGWAMARLVEVPMLRVRDKWFPSRSRSLGEFPAQSARKTAAQSNSCDPFNTNATGQNI